MGPQCLPLCLCLIDIFRCRYFAGVKGLNNVFCIYTEVMAQDDTVTFE